MRIVAGADWAFMRDSSALVYVSQEESGDDYVYRLEGERVWKPGSTPLRPSVVFREAMLDIIENDAEAFCCDDHYLASVLEVCETYDTERIGFPSTTEGIAEAYVAVRVLLGSGALDLSEASEELIDELKDTSGQVLAGGVMRITHKRRGHSHGDRARALVSAIYALQLGVHTSIDEDEQLTTGRRRIARRGRAGDFGSDGKWRDLPPKRREHVGE